MVKCFYSFLNLIQAKNRHVKKTQIDILCTSLLSKSFAAETLTNGSLSLSPPPASVLQAGHSQPHTLPQKDSGGLLQVSLTHSESNMNNQVIF